MNIIINRLRLRNFKNHHHFFYPLSLITRITGTNGAGKSTIGEAITWALYGTDPLGNTLIKALSPEPTNYKFDYVAVELLLTVDDKQVLLERRIEDGDTKYIINEIPAKATAFKELVESLFDKTLFLSLFSPAYFFSQKWEDQRALVLKNVLPPASKEVLDGLPKPQSDKLGELLKKHSIDDLDAKHKDNKTRQDKALIAAKERVKTLQEQLDAVPQLTADEVTKLNAQLIEIDDKIKKQEAAQKTANDLHAKSATLRAERTTVRARADEIAGQYKAMRESPPADHCDKCGQPLEAEALETAKASHLAAAAEMKAKHTELVERFSALTAQIGDLSQADYDPDELRLLEQTARDIGNKMEKAGTQERIETALQEAKHKAKETEDSFKESVFVLDAVKAFRAKEAELMAAKVQGLFETLTLQLFQENKGDGEQKPFFEIWKDGKPYRKLSRGESMIAGLELIDVLTKQNNVVAPVFFDNAESVAKYKQPAGQLIEGRFVFPTKDNNFGEFKIEEVQA